MHRYFESRLQRALAWYALVPVLIMALLGALLMLASWRYAVTGVNHESRELAADVLTGISNDFAKRAAVEAELKLLLAGPLPLSSPPADSPELIAEISISRLLR